MEKLRIAVCDDDVQDIDRLVSLIAHTDSQAVCTAFFSGTELVKQYRRGCFDLVLIDIYMPDITGVEAVRQIRCMDSSVMIAFTTTSTEHALEGYRLDVAKYLEKPVSTDQLKKTLSAARERRSPSFMAGQESVPFDSVLYFEQSAHRINIFLADGRELGMSGKLDNIEALSTDDFMRCHKSYLVNLAFVSAIDKELMVFIMCDGKNVHIRRESMGDARKRFEKYLFTSTRRLGDE